MKQPLLMVVHGAPASGKTQLSQWLSQQLNLPLLSKDDIKEELFNHFDYSDVKKSQAIGAASFDILWLWLRQLMPFGPSLIIETAFNIKYNQPKISDLVNRYGYQVIQVYCQADEAVRQQRFIKRAQGQQRHSGHQDKLRLSKDILANQSQPMDLNCPIIIVDTTDFGSIDYQSLLEQINQELNHEN